MHNDIRPPSQVKEPTPLKWTAEDFYLLCAADWFQGRRVQLVDGEIIEMPAMNNPHAIGIGLANDALRLAFGQPYWVRVQMSLDLSPWSVVDPDLAVVAGNVRSHVGSSNPTSALLIVEVSDTTLAYDRNIKANLYAASGIADYWILNVRDSQLEVYRDAQPEASARFGHRYAARTILDNGDVVSPLAAPAASIAVADLLP